jgi:putative ABC transport system substrate-binding protein
LHCCFCSASRALPIRQGRAGEKIPRIGLITSGTTAEDPASRFETFLLALHDLGHIEGQNIVIERRDAEEKLDKVPSLVQEIIKQKVDLIVATTTLAIRTAKELTKTTPIVMLSSVDPITAGYVESLAHTGGNVTGIAFLARELSAKRVELLKEVIPRMSRITILWDADGAGPKASFKEYEAAAKAFKLDLQSVEVRRANPDFERAFQAAKSQRTDALIIISNPLIRFHQKQVMDLAKRNRFPTMNDGSQYVSAGGLISYGTNYDDLFRRMAVYVDKILKGAKPADLPIERPTKFELVINLKTAKQLGLTIPPNVLARADRVIK